MRSIITLIVLALALTGCSQMLSERRFSSLGHFEQFALNQSTFRITYVGNGYTLNREAEEIALLESARVTLARGFTYFTIIDPPVAALATPQARVSFDLYGGVPLYRRDGVVYRGQLGYDRFYGGFDDSWSIPDRVQVINTIVCSNTASTEHGQFDARIILASLGPKYRLNPDGSEQNSRVVPIPVAASP